MPFQPTTNSKTQQIVVRVPLRVAKQIRVLARTNSTTTTKVMNKLLTVGIEHLPPEVAEKMNTVMASQEWGDLQEQTLREQLNAMKRRRGL